MALRPDDALAGEFVLAGVVDGSEVALSALESTHSSEELASHLAALVMACAGLRWPQGGSVSDLATYLRHPASFRDERSSVSPMVSEAVLRAGAGDSRFLAGLGSEVLFEHMAVVLRILVPDLRTRGATDSEIAALARELMS